MCYPWQLIAQKNKPLWIAGIVSFVSGVLCMVCLLTDGRQLMGVSVWLKPIKFFLSIGLMLWTMGYYMALLPPQRARAIRWYSMLLIIGFGIEMLIITTQAARGQLSHFNISTPINGALFSIMGMVIVSLTLCTLVAAYWFFKGPVPAGYPPGFWWGIALGIVILVLFAFEGMVMAIRLQHTVGAPDGGEGLPVVNWSKQYGDLRIAHFAGMHALQVLPLLGYFVFKTRTQIITVALMYAACACWLFLHALAGKGLLAYQAAAGSYGLFHWQIQWLR